jgi:N-acetylmuramoyl-L-alanine amidase-like protein
MLVNDLASVLRAAGCSVEESAGWTTHNHGELTAVQTIVIHHTGTSAQSDGDYPSYNVVKNGRGAPGQDNYLPGPLAQLGIGRSGKAYTFTSGVAYHAGVVLSNSYDNQHAIGLEVESPGDGSPWPDAQLHGAARAAAALCRHFGLPVTRVLGHKEICSPPGRKVDPRGIDGDMPAFRALVQQYLNGDLEPEAPEEEEDNMVKFVRGDSQVRDENNVPYGYRVFKVEWSGDFAETAVRTAVTNPNDPGYQVHLLTGGKVFVVPQAWLDKVPYKGV